MNLIKIGDLAKKFNITTRALRFYEERGLLYPAKKDKNNEYRYYDESSARQLSKILFLKDLEFSLEEISSLIKEHNTSLFSKKRAELTFIINQLKMFEQQKIDPTTYYLTKKHFKHVEPNPQIEGVWELDGIYSSVADIKNNKPPLNGKISPYKFLAFKKDGSSAWFFTAHHKHINFSTNWLPISEEYRMNKDKLVLNIKSFNEHIFFSANENQILNKAHVLLFKKISNNFEDYKSFLFFDKEPKRKNITNNIGIYRFIGTSNSLLLSSFKQAKERAYLEITKAEAFSPFHNQPLKNYGDCLYNKESQQTMQVHHLKLKGKPVLVIENKTKTYTFSGLVSNYQIFEKITI